MKVTIVILIGMLATLTTLSVRSLTEAQKSEEQEKTPSEPQAQRAVQITRNTVRIGVDTVVRLMTKHVSRVVIPSIQLSPSQIWQLNCPVAELFGFPVGAPDGKGYYDAQPFGKNYHLGEDWNGVGGGNSDMGDSIYAVADGVVFFAEDIQLGWGNVVRILHNTGTKEKPTFIDSLYAHFKDVYVKPGDVVHKGDVIGTMGNCDGLYAAHLHFEMRHQAFMGIGGAYGVDTTGYINPTPFIKVHTN